MGLNLSPTQTVDLPIHERLGLNALGASTVEIKNASASLFVSAKVSQYALLPQGQVEAKDRVLNMVKQAEKEGFGPCSNTGACEVECPKGISLENIARMNREFLSASIK